MYASARKKVLSGAELWYIPHQIVVEGLLRFSSPHDQDRSEAGAVAHVRRRDLQCVGRRISQFDSMRGVTSASHRAEIMRGRCKESFQLISPHSARPLGPNQYQTASEAITSLPAASNTRIKSRTGAGLGAHSKRNHKKIPQVLDKSPKMCTISVIGSMTGYRTPTDDAFSVPTLIKIDINFTRHLVRNGNRSNQRPSEPKSK